MQHITFIGIILQVTNNQQLCIHSKGKVFCYDSQSIASVDQALVNMNTTKGVWNTCKQ